MTAHPTDPMPETPEGLDGWGRIDLVDPSRIVMSGEVDLAVVARFRAALGIGDDPAELSSALGEVRTVDMGQVTFADSSALGVLGALVLSRQQAGAEPITVAGARAGARTVLEISGITPFLHVID